MIRKEVLMVLITFCLTATLFSIIPVGSQGVREYDPLFDINDDGKIDLRDYFGVGLRYGTVGTPINKTALLELQSQIDELKASLQSLQSDFVALNASHAELLSQVGSLNGSVASLWLTVQNYSSILENHTITLNSTYIYSAATTETLNWVDVSGLSVNINVNNTCYLMAMFSTMAYNYLDDFSSAQIYAHAMVDSTALSPGTLYVNPTVGTTGWSFLPSHSHKLNYGTYSYNFAPKLVTAGNHTVKIQWRVSDGTGYLYYSTLTVIAVPMP